MQILTRAARPDISVKYSELRNVFGMRDEVFPGESKISNWKEFYLIFPFVLRMELKRKVALICCSQIVRGIFCTLPEISSAAL